ncbi:MAG TPA: hypothetical protein VFX12_12680 [Vicinamibacterales bacterium]|nr:hypothetical protein [Vicinamibacterales bacterium]
MPTDPVRLEALHAALRDAVDAHVGTLTEQQAQALEAARREGASEAEQKTAARLDALRTELEKEWSSRLQADLDAARADAERRLAAETAKARVDAEQAAAESTAQLRAQLEQAAGAERQRADSEIAAERERAQAAIGAERQRAEAAVAAAQRQAPSAPTQAGTDSTTALVAGVRAIDEAASLGGIFTALLDATAAFSSRALLFVVSGDHLKGIRGRGFDTLDPAQIDNPVAGDGLLATAVKSARTCPASANHPAPSFAALPPEAAGVAVPLILGGHVVAVLYADDREPAGTRLEAWAGAVELLAHHGATALGLLTATRTLEMLGRPGSAEADDQSARRYARLLISEIKLYNESAVRLGRQQRDLLDRLGPEIARARRLYEERVPAGRGAFFQQELLQTLADGDPRLLGAS